MTGAVRLPRTVLGSCLHVNEFICLIVPLYLALRVHMPASFTVSIDSLTGRIEAPHIELAGLPTLPAPC